MQVPSQSVSVCGTMTWEVIGLELTCLQEGHDNTGALFRGAVRVTEMKHLTVLERFFVEKSARRDVGLRDGLFPAPGI